MGDLLADEAEVGITAGHQRAEAQRRLRKHRFDEAFKGKAFDIEAELHLPPGRVCVTLFGRHVRHACILRDKATGERIVVSLRTLQVIFEEYQGVEALPDARPCLTG